MCRCERVILCQTLLRSLAEAELDDAQDMADDSVPVLTTVTSGRGSVQLSSLPEPVPVRAWPLGLALASAPSMTVSLTATGFHKMVSAMASLSLPSRRGRYKVETNQCTRELASIRAQPKVGPVSYHTLLFYIDYRSRSVIFKAGLPWGGARGLQGRRIVRTNKPQ